MDQIFLDEERRIDLGSIKKIDNSITHILDKTDNVAFYRFDGQVWHKQEIQGSIFVFSRSIAPYYGFIIQNRKSLSDNVIELLVDGLEFQRCDLYLLYKTTMSSAGDTGIKSIWFEDEAGCIRLSTLLNKLLRLRNESPTEGAGNILQMFEKSKDRVRQSVSPSNMTCSNSPPHKQSNRKSGIPPRNRGYNNRGDGYQPNNTGHNHGNQRPPHVKHDNSDNSAHVNRGPKTADKNLLNMFSAAHKRYSNNNVCGRKTPPVEPASNPNKPVTIMRRGSAVQPPAQEATLPQNQGISGMCKSRSSEVLTKPSVKEAKSIPITFQDLVNSVQPTPNGRPLSCYSLDGSSSSSAEDNIIMISGSEAANNRRNSETEKSSPFSSNSDQSSRDITAPSRDVMTSRDDMTSRDIPIPVRDVEQITKSVESIHLDRAHSPRSSDSAKLKRRDVTIPRDLTTSRDITDCAKLLMSPLDFKKIPVPTEQRSERSVSNATPAKKMLFEKCEVEEKEHNINDVDIQQFKKLLISAIEDDDEFVCSMYSILQKKVQAR